jgi:hypothetical protein
METGRGGCRLTNPLAVTSLRGLGIIGTQETTMGADETLAHIRGFCSAQTERTLWDAHYFTQEVIAFIDGRRASLPFTTENEH